jgi:purine-binding chemotaxis protein CheW
MSAAHTQPFLWCRIGEQTYGIAIAHVIEVAAMVAFASLPESHPAVCGVINRRGDVLPLLDLRRVFNAPVSSLTPETLFIVVQGETQRAGLIVDEVYQVKYWPTAQIFPAPRSSSFLDSIVSHETELIQVIALNALLAHTLGGTLLPPVSEARLSK